MRTSLLLLLSLLTSSILNPTVASPERSSSGLAPISVPDSTIAGTNPGFETTPLPAEPNSNHKQNATFNMQDLRLATFPVVYMARPIRLEASNDQPIGLQEALEYAMDHNLPIKIARESWVYQRGQLGGQLAGFVPNFSSTWTLQHDHVLSTPGSSINTRVYQDIIRYPVFQGGLVLFGSLVQYYRDKAFHENYNATVKDTLLSVYQNYMNLVLNNALLHIRAKAVEVSQTQLNINNQLFRAGTGTAYAIMQARTQLSSDRLALQQQQINTRQAAVALAFTLNLPMSVNLVPLDENIDEQLVVDPNIGIDELILETVKHRPELRLFELFRLTAARSIPVSVSAMYPNVSLLNAYTFASTSIDPPSAASTANGIAAAIAAAGVNQAGTVNNTALAQTASFSPGASANGTSGANTGAASVVAASNGNPIANIQSGNFVTSGAVAPAFGALFNNAGIAPAANIAGNVGAGVFGGRSNTWQNGFNLNWAAINPTINQLGSLVATRALSRESLVQANQELQYVAQLVHQDCIGAYVARKQIDAASYGLDSSAEELRIAQLRLKSGVGTSLEVVQAERDYITSLVNKVQAIITSNQTQAQLLHDTGLISMHTLLNGYRKQ
jgi:outer membrane protein TolC